jgi:hypothetical protein
VSGHLTSFALLAGRFLAVGLPPIPSITRLEAIFHFQPDPQTPNSNFTP